MAGKAYTMREMRAIVEYLTDHKAYGEIKGRKMWMEYANSEKTVRTWQSLKETFLKRILPDIQNPYYKLTMDQVRSFRQGYDVVEREKNNRLEFRTASEDSNEDNQNAKEKSTTRTDNEPPATNENELPTATIDNKPPSTSIDEELEKVTGESIKSAKIPSRSRSSADTVVLEYENADEIQQALESPKNDERVSKSFKDLLTFEYSAPLTPLVRELLDDFETESETSDKESQLNIDENPRETNTVSEPMALENIPSENCNTNNDAESLIEIHDTLNLPNTVTNADGEPIIVESGKTEQKDVQNKSDVPKINEPLKNSEDNKKEDHNNEANIQEPSKQSSLQDNNVTSADPKDITEFLTAEPNAETFQKSPENNVINKKKCNNTIANTGNSTQNTGNTSSDTILPNNQEALDDSKKAAQKSDVDKTEDDPKKVENNEKIAGKRSTTQDNRESKKQKLSGKTSKGIKEDEKSIPVIVINDTPSDHDTASVLEKNTEIPDTKIIAVNTNTLTSNVTEELFNALLETVQENIEASKSAETDVTNIPMNEDKDTEIVEDKNPCLLSVSLFDEQFKNTKYSDSDCDDEATPVLKKSQNKDKTQAETKEKKENTEVVVVENDQIKKRVYEVGADHEPQRQENVNKNNNVVNKAMNLQRERALANVFGFAHGFGATTSRQRHISHSRKSHNHRRPHSRNNNTNTSEWTSESDSDSYVSPPRGRRNRQTRKYLKPKSSRVLHDPEEGMLYVMFGKKIYPLVKDGRHIKNFLTYRPDSGSDVEEESYWKQKYVEEKNRVEEVKQLLKESRESKAPPTSPILPSTSRNSTTTHSQRKSGQNGNSKELIAAPKVENKTEATDKKLVLKIAARNGLEYCLEGGWSQISNAMPQIVKMLQTEARTPKIRNLMRRRKEKTVEQQFHTDDVLEVSSGASTPVTATLAIDPEVHEKINKIETEIFKEIEEREMEEQVRENEAESTNITKRKPGRPRKDSSIVTSQSPAKRARVSKTSSTESKQAATKPESKRISKQKLGVIPNKQIEFDEIEKPKTQTRSKIKKHQTKTTEPRAETTEPQTDTTEPQTDTTEPQAETTEPQTDTTEPQTKTTEEQTETVKKQTNTTEHQTETTKQKEFNPTLRTKFVKKQQNDVIDLKQPKRRESLRLSKRNETNEDDRSSRKSPVERRSSSRTVRTPRKYETDSSASDTRVRSEKSTSKETTALLGFDDENTRYMFPPSPKSNRKSPRSKFRSLPKINIVPVQENTSGNSIDSTQGYQDSDASSMIVSLPKRKKKVSLVTQNKYKNRRIARRNSYPTFIQELSSDSNNSSYFIPLRRSQGSLNSEIYRTDSFQLLVPKEKQSFHNKLERITETSSLHQLDANIRHFNSVSKDSDASSNEKSNILVEIGSSSVISLPLSPELSVVENLSISREMIKNENHPTINEIESNISSHAMDFSEYMISNVDVSVPLMNQQCELRNSTDKLTPKKNTAKSTQFPAQIFNKDCTVRIENLTLSETLDQKLRDLLLESCKKTPRAHNKENAMEVDQTKISTVKKTRTRRSQKENAVEVDESKIALRKNTRSRNQKENVMEVDESKNKTTKKTRAKKRSSTPQKKKSTGKPKASKAPVIEEEHMESCTYAGRNSCPPVITHLPIDENVNNCADVTVSTVKVSSRKKKDVIKVKIQRPREQSREQLQQKSVGNVSVVSAYTDSGINGTETISGVFKESEDSVDLIHNHSETCLLANECIENSVEFVDNSKSIISLISSEESVYSELQKILDDAASLSGELFNNSQHNSTAEPRTSEEIFESPETVYHTPAATNSSLITEDLSDDPLMQPTKWYLLSEDDTDTLPALSLNLGSYGANLKQIFPITYAIPDLSTISELSKENEDSRKPHFDTDGDTGNCDSQNLS